MGRRGANQTAVFFAGIGTLCCGLSNSLEMLIAARFVSVSMAANKKGSLNFLKNLCSS
jgi:MFS family permease